MPSLAPNTPLARYIFDSGDIRSDGKPRPGIFKPKMGDDLSVYDIEGFEHPQCCEHGHLYADNAEAARIHIGYATTNYRTYEAIGLSGIYDNTPPRHVSIGPTNVPEYRREQAKVIAAKATVSRCLP